MSLPANSLADNKQLFRHFILDHIILYAKIFQYGTCFHTHTPSYGELGTVHYKSAHSSTFFPTSSSVRLSVSRKSVFPFCKNHCLFSGSKCVK